MESQKKLCKLCRELGSFPLFSEVWKQRVAQEKKKALVGIKRQNLWEYERAKLQVSFLCAQACVCV